MALQARSFTLHLVRSLSNETCGPGVHEGFQSSRPVSLDSVGRRFFVFVPFNVWFPGGVTLSQPCIIVGRTQ